MERLGQLHPFPDRTSSWLNPLIFNYFRSVFMKITLNGSTHTVDAEAPTITELVASLPIGGQPVLVELNGEAVLVREFDDRRIHEGDTVEVIRMVAGG